MPIYFRVSQKGVSSRNSRANKVIPEVNQDLQRVLGQDRRPSLLGIKPFGYFREVFRTDESIVYEFSPSSREAKSYRAEYRKNAQAVVAAEKYLGKKKLKVLTFDLEAMVDGLS